MALASTVSDDRHFNFDTTIKQLKEMPYDDIVKALESRIYKWFIYPVDLLVQRDLTEGHLCFPMILIDCALIESLCQFYEGKLHSSAKDYKSFLRRIIPDFCTKLNQKEQIQEQNRTVKLTDYADVFYHAFRNGLMHSAMIKPCGKISGLKKILEYDEINGILTVYPVLLHAKLTEVFKIYIQTLLSKKERVKEFREKMKSHFGVTVPDPFHL